MYIKNFSRERAERKRRRRIRSIIFSSVSAAVDIALAFIIVALDGASLKENTVWGIAIASLLLVCFIVFDVIEIRGLIREGKAVASAEGFGEAHDVIDSTPLRGADGDVVCKVLLEAEPPDYKICYRRVRTVNELVINGYVYDEFKGLFEPEHTLCAHLNGHVIEAGLDDLNCSFITLDDELLNYKQRVF